MGRIGAAVLVVSCVLQGSVFAQVRAGSAEGALFDKISREMNPETKLELVTSFEQQFPASRVLSQVYLTAIEIYRQKGDREKINELGEKVLKLDGNNITAMMILARSYAIESKNIDRALELAQRAVDSAAKLGREPLPVGYSDAQWKDYLRSNEDAAGQILSYVKAIKGRLESIPKATGNASSIAATAETPTK